MRQGKPKFGIVALTVLLLSSSTLAGVTIQGIDIDGGSLAAGEATSKILVKKEAWGGEYVDARVGDELQPGAFLSSADESACLTLFRAADGEEGSTAAVTGKFRIAIAPSSAEGLCINLLAGAVVIEGDANSTVEYGEAKAASEGTTYQVQIVESRSGVGYVCLVFEGRVRLTGYGSTQTVGASKKLVMVPGRRGFNSAPFTSADINQTAMILARKDLSLARAAGRPVPDRNVALRNIEEQRAVVLRDPADAEGRIQLVNTLMDIGAVKAVPYQLEQVRPLPGNRVVKAQKTLVEFKLGRPISERKVEEAMATVRESAPALVEKHLWIREIGGERAPPRPPEEGGLQPDRAPQPEDAIRHAFRQIDRRSYVGAKEILVKEYRKGYRGSDLYIGLALADLGMENDRGAASNGLLALGLPPGPATGLSRNRIDELVTLTGGQWTARTKFNRGWGEEFLRRKMYKPAQQVFSLRIEAGSKDARDFFGAGLAAQALGDRRGAGALMKRALLADRTGRTLTDRQREQATRMVEGG